jgi:alanyl-tRNA synthetase
VSLSEGLSSEDQLDIARAQLRVQFGAGMAAILAKLDEKEREIAAANEALKKTGSTEPDRVRKLEAEVAALKHQLHDRSDAIVHAHAVPDTPTAAQDRRAVVEASEEKVAGSAAAATRAKSPPTLAVEPATTCDECRECSYALVRERSALPVRLL